MKTVFAMALLAASTQAGWVDQAISFNQWTASKGIPVTRHDVHKYHKKGHRTTFVKHPNHDIIMEEAVHSVKAQRIKLGKPMIGAGDSENSYENLDTLVGRILGTFQGLQYSTSGGGNSACFTAIESFILAVDNGFSVYTKMYLPFYWSDAQLVTQDSIALYAGAYTECDVNKFFNSMSHLASSEGISEMGARGSGAYMFQFKDYKKVMADTSSTKFQKGVAWGSLFSTIADYTI